MKDKARGPRNQRALRALSRGVTGSGSRQGLRHLPIDRLGQKKVRRGRLEAAGALSEAQPWTQVSFTAGLSAGISAAGFVSHSEQV